MELISIVVPVYNRAEIFVRALESVVAQTYRPLQIIVVDDGSSESIAEVFETFSSKYSTPDCSFEYIRQENKGAPAARNRGLAGVRGDSVIFWDADAIGKSEMLQKMHDVLVKNPDASFAYSNFLLGRKLFRGKFFSHEDLKKNNYITTTSLIRRKDVVEWDENLKRFQDWDMWLTMAEQGKKGVWINEFLFQIETGGTISFWLPSYAYRIPFRFIPFIWKRVREYDRAKRIVQRKHNLLF